MRLACFFNCCHLQNLLRCAILKIQKGKPQAAYPVK